MHQFICKSAQGKIVPEQDTKRKLYHKLLKSYEEQNMRFKVTIEVIKKNVNESQLSLYRAFIVKAHLHFGNTYEEMEQALKRFYPKNDLSINDNYKPLDKWNSSDLDNFINQANALLLEADSDFKF